MVVNVVFLRKGLKGSRGGSDKKDKNKTVSLLKLRFKMFIERCLCIEAVFFKLIVD